MADGARQAAERGGTIPGEASREGFGPDAAHLLRTTQAIQYQLSQMADTKANIVLAITFVIFSLSVGQARGGGAPPLPLLVMGVAALVAATLAVMAVLPSVRSPPPRFDGGANILFFGSFSQLSEAEFTERLLGSLGDNRAVFETWARDIYQNGCVLAAKKYRLLGYAYRVLLVGLLASAVAFIGPIVAHWFGVSGNPPCFDLFADFSPRTRERVRLTREVFASLVTLGVRGAGKLADGEQGSMDGAHVTTAPAIVDADYAPDGVHLLRTTQQIQYQLSQMADQKASMLLGITFVIFTLTLGTSRVAAPQPPQLILGGAAFLAATLTIFAVLPSVKPPADHGHNILFFGAFAGMKESDYIETMLKTVSDPQKVHEAFARDIFQNGRVLSGKKYRLLGYAYRVLLLGLFSSVTAFVTPLVVQWATGR